jgi:hypothetical protein
MAALAAYVLYLAAGRLALAWAIKYSPLELRREVEANGVDCPPGDRFFDFLLAGAYLFVMSIWPLAIYRKIRTGRVVGRV